MTVFSGTGRDGGISRVVQTPLSRLAVRNDSLHRTPASRQIMRELAGAELRRGDVRHGAEGGGCAEIHIDMRIPAKTDEGTSGYDSP